MQWLMLQQEKPEDYVIASGQMKSVREFIELSAIELGWNKEIGGKVLFGKDQELMKLEEEWIITKLL